MYASTNNSCYIFLINHTLNQLIRYHMPCMFREPKVMMAHCALSAQHLSKFAGGLPFVYCGDFNIKPESSMYGMMTEGRITDP